MFTTFYLGCALLGGVIVIAQLLASLFAMGAGHGFHLHHHHGGAIAHRGGPRGIRTGHRSATRPHKPHRLSRGALNDHGVMAWLHNLFNFQGIVAGLTVLGLAGLAATAADLPRLVTLVIGLASALVMMALVAGLFGMMVSMENDGTVQLEKAVGAIGTVYLGIPPRNEGQGKITLTLQQQVMEFPAVTSQEAPLSTGQKVLVIAVQKPTVMEVVSADKYLADLRK